VTLEIRYADRDAYAMFWQCGDVVLGIDTAPVHASLSSHLHGGAAQVLTDPFSSPGAEPWDNVQRVIGNILHSPLL
jgi:hypothetical protein